jgi:N-acetylglucosaminyl-diphospho-decaprenol L-rhamnosyltransferase
MSVSVLVPVRDRLGHLTNLVRGLARQNEAPLELVVARMGGEDPRPALAEAPGLQSRVIDVAGEELPLSRARNELAGTARGETLVFLDVDCIPCAGLVGTYSAALREHDALAAGPALYLPRGAGSEEEDGLRARAGRHPGRERLFSQEVRLDRRHDLFWSLNFGLRRSTFLERIGGFDEGYRGYGIEDTDFALRARVAAVPVAWVPGAAIYHQHHPPTRHNPDGIPALVRNACRFQRRWGFWPARGWLRELADRGEIRWDEAAELLEARS